MAYSAIIEIPKGSFYKYEINKEIQALKLDRILPIPCPFNYGFLPRTLSADGDPTDIFIVSDYPIIPLTEVKFETVGILLCEDNGVEDNKIIAFIEGDLTVYQYDWVRDIKFYLNNYKTGFVIKDYVLLNSNEELKKYLKS